MMNRAGKCLALARWWAVLNCCVLLGCVDLTDYRTGDNEVFRGGVVGSPPRDAGTEEEAFLLHGFAADTLMDLTFDPLLAAGSGREPVGTIDTYRCTEPMAPCPLNFRQVGPISAMSLHAIPGLSRDVLSQYDFPGGNRVRSFILHGSFTSGTTPRSAMVFVSLMAGGGIEVRIAAPPIEARDTRLPALFGLFPLGRTGS